jgi:hypothetical protein
MKSLGRADHPGDACPSLRDATVTAAFDAFVQGAPLFLSEAKVGFVAYRDLDQIDLRYCPARGRSSLICVHYEQSNAWTFVVESS